MSAALKNVHIFLGSELGKKQDAVNAVREKLSKKTNNIEETVFYAGETPISEIADTLLNISLFADEKIIIIKNAELLKKKDEIELLVSCFKNMEENTSLIFFSDENKLAVGFEDTLPKNVNRQIFYEMFEKEKNEWVRQFFYRAGVNIDNDCISTILELVENNTDALKRECTRIISFSTEGQTINAQDIEKWLSHNREESAFTLFSRIAIGDLSKALESLSVMLAAKESAQRIMSGLTSCFRKLGDYLALQETGISNNSFELKKIGIVHPKTRDDYIAASRRYNFESVEACLALTAEYELLLRSPVAVMENILMDRYILSLIKYGKRITV